MSRANEQGFTTPVWHGTKHNFNEFRGPLRTDGGDFGIHVATVPETANRATGTDLSPDLARLLPEDRINHAHLRGTKTLPMLARIQNSLRTPDMGIWKTPSNWIGILGDPAYMNQSGKMSQAHRHLRPPMDPGLLDEILQLAYKHQNPRNVQYDPSRVASFQSELNQLLRGKNYDSIQYPNHTEGRGEDSYLLLDPSQLRSIFAKFDPRNIGSKDLLAGAAPPMIMAQPKEDK